MPTISFICPQCKTQLRGPAEMEGKKARCKGCGTTFVVKAAGGAKPSASGQAKTARAPANPAKAPPAKAAPVKAPAASPAQAASPPPPKAAELDDHAAPYTLVTDEEWVPPAAPTIPAQPAKGQPARKYDDGDSNPYGVTDMDLAPRRPYCAKEMESEDAVICLHCGYNTQTRTSPRILRTIANTGRDRFMWLLPGVLCAVATVAFIGLVCFLWLALHTPEVKGDAPKSEDFNWFPVQIWGSVISGVGIWLAGRFAVKRLVLHPNPPEFEKK